MRRRRRLCWKLLRKVRCEPSDEVRALPPPMMQSYRIFSSLHEIFFAPSTNPLLFGYLRFSAFFLGRHSTESSPNHNRFSTTGGELLKYTYTLFGGNYCLNGQKTKRKKKKKITVILGFLVAETSRKHHHWHFWANPSQWWGQCGKMNNFLVT